MAKKIMSVLVVVLSIFMLYYFVGCQSTAKTSAKVYLQQDNIEKAIEQLEIDVQQNPQDAESHYLLGYCYGQKGRFKEMIRELDASLAISDKYKTDIEKIKRKYWIDNFNTGIRKVQSEQFAEAIPYFKMAIAILPSDPKAYRSLAFAYAKLDSLKKAETFYKRALEIQPEDVHTLISLGTLYYKAKKYDDAIATFEKVLKIDASNKDAIYYIAVCYDLKGEPDKALEMYNEALKANPDEKDLYFNRGRLFYLREDYDNAIKDFKKVLAIDSTDFDAFCNLGKSYLFLGDRLFKQGNELEQKAGSANKAKIKELKEKEIQFYRKSLEYLLKAAKIKPEDPNLWYDIGVAYVRMGEPEKGKEAFEKSDELKSKK